jgi:hypothetical protein
MAEKLAGAGGDAFFYFNGTGTIVWRVNGVASLAQADVLLSDLGIDPETCSEVTVVSDDPQDTAAR